MDEMQQIQTAYCIQGTTHHLVASALRMITNCVERPELMDVWHDATTWRNLPAHPHQPIATSYHCAPAHNGWVIVYPNVMHTVPFAAALSRQTRHITVGITNQRREAWDRGHPALLPIDTPSDLLDARYFCEYRLPPVLDWAHWIHLWHPRWTRREV